MFAAFKKRHYICNPKREVGTVAQSVEQWTENPCVAGSIPAHTTLRAIALAMALFLCLKYILDLAN